MRVAELTPEQMTAVRLGDGAHLLTAPPGSGKTEVLVRRIIRLLEKSAGDTFRILALTYTVRAAGELQERIRETVEDRDQWRVNASTFHAFALDLLQHYGKAVGLRRPINVVSGVQEKRILLSHFLDASRNLAGTARLDIENDRRWSALFSEIARRKTNLDPPQPGDGDNALGTLPLHDAYDAYEAALADSGAVDYEGMISQAVRLLRVDPWVGTHLRRQYRHTLVDEGQELTRGQYELLKKMCGVGNKNVFIVADVDQSINSFTGAGPTFLQEFVDDFAARRSHLTTNFRSAKTIVAVLQSLRNSFSEGMRQPLQLAVPKDVNLASGWIGARSYPNEQSEANAISEWILSLLDKGLDRSWTHDGESTEVTHEDICLLGRTRYAFGAIVTELGRQNLPVVLRTEQGALFESRLGRSGYCTLQLIENPGDLAARIRLLTELDGATPKNLRPSTDFGEVRTALRQRADRNNLPQEFVEVLVSTSNQPMNSLEVVSELIRLDLASPQDDMGGWYRDQQLLGQLLSQYELPTSAPNRSLSGFLGMLSQLGQAAPSEPGVRALTPYRARGLGFKAVVVMGMNEGTLPDYRATSDDKLNEERRVAYVAASRAARALLLTRPRERLSRYGNPYSRSESRFIQEMGLTMEYIT